MCSGHITGACMRNYIYVGYMCTHRAHKCVCTCMCAIIGTHELSPCEHVYKAYVSARVYVRYS